MNHKRFEWMLVGIPVFVGALTLFVAGFTNLDENRPATMIVTACLMAAISFLVVKRNIDQTDKYFDQRRAREALGSLFETSFKTQIGTIINDWRNRDLQFHQNQVNLLYKMVGQATKLGYLSGYGLRRLNSSFEVLIHQVEQKRCGNVILVPPTLKIFAIDWWNAEISIAGELKKFDPDCEREDSLASLAGVPLIAKPENL